MKICCFFTTSVGALLPKRKILFEHARRLGSHDYFDVIYSIILPRAEVPHDLDIVCYVITARSMLLNLSLSLQDGRMEDL